MPPLVPPAQDWPDPSCAGLRPPAAVLPPLVELEPPELLELLELLEPPQAASSRTRLHSTPASATPLNVTFIESSSMFHGSAIRLRVEGVLQTIPHQIERQHGQQQGHAGKQHVPPDLLEVGRRVRD